MTATNMTGIVVFVIILNAFNLKEFLKPIYAVWLVICIIFVPIGIGITLNSYPYKGQVITSAINIVLYGFILVRLLSDLVKTRKFDSFRIPVFICWIVMLVLMLLSVNENIWPLWYAAVFGSFYLANIDKNAMENIYRSITDGIILGFFVIQGLALLFRPYDIVRYSGLYVNPNFNALFYLMTYSAFLCKWFLLKKESKYFPLRVVLGLFAGAMYGFCIYTGSKTAILAMLLVTFPFIFLSLKYCKRKVLSFAGYWVALGLVGIISVPIVYGAIRYMPTVHLHPLYFEGEYSEYRVQPGEPRDSEKYITFEYAIDDNMGRMVYIFSKLFDYIDSCFVLKVYAAEADEVWEPEYIFSNEEADEGIDPISLRYEIHKYYFDRLNIVGHTNDYEGAPIHYFYTAPHAHNVFIQMAFLYGIPAGVMFIVMVLSYILGCIGLIKAGEEYRVCIISCFIIAFVVFGFFEIDWMCGQLPFTLFFLLFRDVVRKQSKVNSL